MKICWHIGTQVVIDQDRTQQPSTVDKAELSHPAGSERVVTSCLGFSLQLENRFSIQRELLLAKRSFHSVLNQRCQPASRCGHQRL